MTNSYKLASTWRYLLIVPSVALFVMFWSLVIFGDVSGGIPVGAWLMLICISGVTGWMIYGSMISQITTSPEGIESVMLGVRVEAAWSKVEKIAIAQDGLLNLVFKEPVFKSKFANTLFHLLGYDKVIQLSPFIENVADSKLLKDIVNYLPNSNIPEFVVQQKHSTKSYQKAGMIGLYYFSWFLVLILFGIVFQEKVEQYFTALGLRNVTLISNFVMLGLLVGLFVNTMRLLGYNADIAKSAEHEIPHKARAHYLSPLVILLISLVVGMGIWAFFQRPPRFEVFIMFLIGAVSLWVSSKMERLLFRDDR